MVTIRLARHGSKKNPFYHITVADRAASRDGRFIERLGHYDPKADPAEVKLDLERFDYWVQNGAKATRTVATLAKRVREQAAG